MDTVFKLFFISRLIFKINKSVNYYCNIFALDQFLILHIFEKLCSHVAKLDEIIIAI